jgi:hypothetical protein
VKRIIIGCSGYGFSGKDSVGRILTEHHGFDRVAFADALKAEAIELGWDGTKGEGGRRFLQTLGERRRKESPTYWIRKALDAIDQCGPRVVITDVRYKNELQMIRDRGGLLWRVVRSGVNAANDHISERDLDDVVPDVYLLNVGSLNSLRWNVEIQLKKAGLL